MKGLPSFAPPESARHLDLRVFRNLTPVVARRRYRLRLEVATFVHTRLGFSMSDFLAQPATTIDSVLADFGQMPFAAGAHDLTSQRPLTLWWMPDAICEVHSRGHGTWGLCGARFACGQSPGYA